MSVLILDNQKEREYESSEDEELNIRDVVVKNEPESHAPAAEEMEETPRKLVNLSFSGGGFKGIAFLGCVKGLEESGLMKDIESVAGSSAGGIVASLIACKCTYKTMRSLLVSMLAHFQKYKVSWFKMVKNARVVNDNFGVYKTDELKDYFNECFRGITNCSDDLTFGELFEKTGIKLIITATCLDTNTPFYFSKDTTADTTIAEALCISVSIPLIFAANKFQGKVMVDGGIVEHIPLQCWDEKEIPHTMAFLVKSRNEIYDVGDGEVDTMYDYAQKLYNSIRKDIDDQYYIKYVDTIALIQAGNLHAYKRMPEKDEISKVVYSSYFQTLRALYDRGFCTSCKIPIQTEISSFIQEDPDFEDDISTPSVESNGDVNDVSLCKHMDILYKVMYSLSVAFCILVLVKIFRKS